MSTKTTFKRVALVAVASLGFGMLSVVSASAVALTITTVAGTTTPAVPSVGIPVVTTLKATSAAAGDATSTHTFTATLVYAPGNSAVTSTSWTAGVLNRSAAYPAVAAATANSVTAATNVLTLVSGAGATAQLVNTDTLGEFSFTPDVPGIYRFSILAVATVGGTTDVSTATTSMVITVGGAQLTQATGGKGSAVGTATTGGSAVVSYTPPVATGANTIFNIVSTGVGSVTNPIQCASIDNTITAALPRCTAGTPAGQAVAPINGTNFVDGIRYTSPTAVVNGTGELVAGAAALTGSMTFDAASTVAGVQTITVTSIALATGVPTARAVITITWGANPTASTSLTQVWAKQGSVRPTALETTALRLPSTAGVAASSTGTSVVAIAVNVISGENTALNGVPVSATISGPGLLSITSGAGDAAIGTARSVALTATNQVTASQSIIGVSGDGTRGVATITISSGTTVLATKTVTFYGAVATLTATQGVSIMRSGRTATSTVADFTLGGVDPTVTAAAATTAAQAVATNITIVAKDVDGNTVPLTAGAVTAEISDSAVIGAVNIAACANTNLATSVCAAGDGTWIANTVAAVGGVSGASATVTFKTAHPTLPATFITAVVPFTLGGSKTGGTVTMTLDKATYEPGERMIITYTAKDAAGNPVYDWATTGTPAANKSMVGLTGGIYVKGSLIYGDGATELTYAPTAPGPFTITLGTGTSSTATITATATVADDAATTAAAAAGDAAAEATDAANAATDAANAAAEAADAATAAAQDAADAVAALSTSVTAMVADLRKQITSLTNLVIKIQKKVKA